MRTLKRSTCSDEQIAYVLRRECGTPAPASFRIQSKRPAEAVLTV